MKQLNHGTDRLENELKSRNFSFANGLYMVNVPVDLKVKPKDAPLIVDEVLTAIKNTQTSFNIKNIGQFKIHKVDNQGSDIGFGSCPPAEWIDSPNIIHQNIYKKLKIANAQLGSFQNHTINKKILLLVNKYIFGDDISDFIEALTYSYNELLIYKNIDEIWLQIKTWHILLYTREFATSFDRCELQSTEQSVLLFEKWFCPLEKLGNAYKEKLFIILKKFIESKKPCQVFKDKIVRERMVQLGDWLADGKRYKDIIWLIDKFIDDPDPEDPQNYTGDPRFNYHEVIAKGEDPLIITSVLGHLAWVIQKLAIQKDYITKALSYIKHLFLRSNLYVKYQCIFPLIAISARQQWLDGCGKRPYEGLYKEFHQLVFDLIKLVKENPNYKVIAEKLCCIFRYYKDLSTKEAEQVLDALKNTDESADLFIYFGIFRQRYYRNQNIEFNTGKFEDVLKTLIKDRSEKSFTLRSNIAWHFREILDDTPQEFNAIKPFIDLFLEQPYEKHILEDIGIIINGQIKANPEVCTRWYKVLLDRIAESIDKEKHLQPRDGMLLICTEEMNKAIAEYSPNELVEVMEKLVNLWNKGMHIGELKILFESYRLIKDEKQKIIIKQKFRKMHDSMRRLEPKLEKIDWS